MQVRQIRKDAAEFCLLPFVEVTGVNGKPVYGVEYHTAILPDGRKVVYTHSG